MSNKIRLMMRFLACLAILVAVACSRKEPEAPRPVAMPAVCNKMQFDAVVEALDDIAFKRDEILVRADKYPVDEPAEFLRLVSRDERELDALAAQAKAVDAPRCLHAALPMFADYLDKSRVALEARHPGEDPSVFRERRDTADAVLGQYKTEVRQQRANAQ
jgi:hypothetical protein